MKFTLYESQSAAVLDLIKNMGPVTVVNGLNGSIFITYSDKSCVTVTLNGKVYK